MDTRDAKCAAFFARHNFDSAAPSVEHAAAALWYDLKLGLEAVELPHTQEMLPTWITVQKPLDKTIIALDAGGTNFRSFLIELRNGQANVLKEKKGKLPALETELTKDEFFESLAESIDYIKDEASEINFCFAYALEMTMEKDARVLRMSKEVQVAGILNAPVGASLFDALQKRGWKKLKKVSVINDTAAALLSGLSLNKTYSAYIGMILGTGFNIAYTESKPIPKLSAKEQLLGQIVVCETAKTNRVVSSDFDTQLRASTIDGNVCKLEKMCSGAYLGELISIAYQCASAEDLFTEKVSQKLSTEHFDFKTINEFLVGENSAKNKLSQILESSHATEDDIYVIREIAVQFLKRTARIVASALISVALKTEQGRNASTPICIAAEGTTFSKAFLLKHEVLAILKEELTKKHGIFFELHEIGNAVALGTAFF